MRLFLVQQFLDDRTLLPHLIIDIMGIALGRDVTGVLVLADCLIEAKFVGVIGNDGDEERGEDTIADSHLEIAACRHDDADDSPRLQIAEVADVRIYPVTEKQADTVGIVRSDEVLALLVGELERLSENGRRTFGRLRFGINRGSKTDEMPSLFGNVTVQSDIVMDYSLEGDDHALSHL